MSNLVLLLINIFIRLVSWEEHYPWVISEFIFVNYSLTLLIHFSTGSKTIILLAVWFGKEKLKKIAKQCAREDSAGFQNGIRKHGRKKSLSTRLLCFCFGLVALHTLL